MKLKLDYEEDVVCFIYVLLFWVQVQNMQKIGNDQVCEFIEYYKVRKL